MKARTSYYGRFGRSFNIPNDAEADDLKGEFKDGVLRVHLAKSERLVRNNQSESQLMPSGLETRLSLAGLRATLELQTRESAALNIF